MSKRKTVRPEVREISPVSVSMVKSMVERLEEEVCFKSTVTEVTEVVTIHLLMPTHDANS